MIKRNRDVVLCEKSNEGVFLRPDLQLRMCVTFERIDSCCVGFAALFTSDRLMVEAHS